MTLTQINKAGLDEIALDHVFTIGASGSSAYTFQGEGLNGTVNNPTLYLTRGKTYRFENGSGGHPIRIQSTSGASGTAYNTGVTNNAGSGTVIVEVQHDAPDVLYYQCTSHSAMNGILYITGALPDGGVTTAKIADNAVTGAKILNGAVDSNKLGSLVVTTAKIANNAVTTTKIADSQVITAKINDSAVTTAKIAADAVTGAKIADDAINSEHYTDGSIDTAHIADSQVTNAKLADNSVSTARIIDGAVNANKLGTAVVTTAKIEDNAVTSAKIANEAVTLAKLPHGTSSNDGKFLRANNGADPTFETVSTDLVADTSPQLGGDLATNNHAINFGDSSGELNDRANFGDDKDLQIFYNGTNSYITNDTNDLLIQNTGDDIYIDAADDIFIRTSNNEDAIKCLGDGAVELYNNNTKRLETSSDGYYYYGTITGGTAARSNAGITQTNVLTPATRFFTGGYGTQDQNVTIQATTGNWQGGSSSTSHRSSGILFNRINNSVQQIRAGIQHDINGSEKFKIHCSYGDISFRTQSNAHGNKVWEDCDREPLILHHDGHVAMLHMPYAYWSPGGDSNTYQTDGTEHLIDGSSANTMRNGMSIDTSNGRITVPYSGVYQVNANIGLYRTTGSSRSRLNLMKNGTDVIRQEHANENANSDGGWKTFNLSHAIELGANDYISFDCVGKHDSGVYAVVTVVLLHGDAT